MLCPRCACEQETGEECRQCGLIFARYQARSKPRVHPPLSAARAWRSLLLGGDGTSGDYLISVRALLLAGLIAWGLAMIWSTPAATGAAPGFLHLVNTPFHEAGHIFFRPFGTLITSLGGSLGQLLMPLICCLTLLLKTRDPFGSSVALWWLGQNFIDIAPYINDARAGELMLLGGNTGASSPYGFHDWEYILTELGIQNCDHGLAWGAHLCGAFVMIIALTWGGMILWHHYKARTQN